ncbi:MAG: hypothetical protein IH786_07305, partial [Proteobacteria bacterium]|nr:hypothetical protein [Pseudomonadota bacterium]
VLKVGQKIQRLESVLTHWVNLGYRHEPVVESPGTFSQRGGIIDVYPTQSEHPLRVELWDDEVDTIRRFDPFTHQTPTGLHRGTGLARTRWPAAGRAGRGQRLPGLPGARGTRILC